MSTVSKFVGASVDTLDTSVCADGGFWFISCVEGDDDANELVGDDGNGGAGGALGVVGNCVSEGVGFGFG